MGSVLVLGGSDGGRPTFLGCSVAGLWPSPFMEEMISEYRAETGAAHADDEHRSYPGAGHGIYIPYRPMTVDYGVVYGGTVSGDAHATADAWSRVEAFLSGE